MSAHGLKIFLLKSKENVNCQVPHIGHIESANGRNNSQHKHDNARAFRIFMQQNDDKWRQQEQFKISSNVMRVCHANIFKAKPIVNHEEISPPIFLAQLCLIIN